MCHLSIEKDYLFWAEFADSSNTDLNADSTFYNLDVSHIEKDKFSEQSCWVHLQQ